MGKGKSKESAAQERANLLGINPIANRASGTFMTQHSHAALQSKGSPLHHKGFGDGYKHTHEGIGDKISNKLKDAVNYQESGRSRNIGWGNDWIPNVEWKSDDWSSGYSDVQDQFKKVAPNLSGKK